jgi:leader peptidase (prepilin peptidase) / N-methyltransferase
MMSLTITLVVLSFFILILATWSDLKTREVPDTLSYGFILSVFLIRGLYATQDGFGVLVWGIIGFVAMLILGLVLYYTKQWGGGDSKIFMGLGAAFGDLWLYDMPFLLILFLIVILFGTIYGSIWGVYTFFKHKSKTIPALKRTLHKKRMWAIYSVSLGVILLVFSFFTENLYVKVLLLVLALSIGTLFYLYSFVKVVEEVGFLQNLPLSKVTEGDWLAKDILVNGKVICSSKKPCIDKKQLVIMKKHKVNFVLIKVGIPFLPPILLGFIVSFWLYLF